MPTIAVGAHAPLRRESALPPVLRFVLVLTIGLTLVVGTHLYLYRRFVRDVFADRRQRRVGGAVLALLALLLVLGLPGSRVLPRAAGEVVGFLAFGWMGVIAVTVPLLFLVDLLRVPYVRWRQRRDDAEGPAPADPGRRVAISRGVAAVTALGAGTTSAAGFKSAFAAPELREIEVPLGVPAGLRGLRIVQITDVHVGPTIGRAFMDDLVDRINALDADVVAITGDLVDGTVRRLGPHTEPLGRITSRLGTFFVTGNHEYYSGADPWIAELTRLGIKVLRNERVTVERGGAKLDIAGVDDWRAEGFGGDHGHFPDKALGGRPTDRPVVLLAHQPKSVFDAARHGVDLVLSGHTHGGQIWPFAAIVKLVQPYVKGLYRHDEKTWIYVHPGTGYWGPPMRVGVPAEIAVLTLT